MGMSTHVSGFREPDDQYRKMAAAWRACVDVGIDPPDEVEEFFNYDGPDDSGVEVNVPHREWSRDMSIGVTIRVEDIPAGVTELRFWNSW
jgi:hypothetical protein